MSQDCAELDIAFEDILGRPEDLVNDMATRLGLVNKVRLTRDKIKPRTPYACAGMLTARSEANLWLP